MRYKRNQIEEGISRCINAVDSTPSEDLLNRLKRLLDTDRKSIKGPYAFYSTKPSGKGVEVEFSEYEAFALLTGVRLLDHGFPQQGVVSLLQHVRPEFEREHARILRIKTPGLFEQTKINAAARPGQIATSNSEPGFLVIETHRTKDGKIPAEGGDGFHLCKNEAEMMRAVKSKLGTHTIFETVTSAVALHHHLSETEPRPRGRRPRRKRVSRM
jgi:hypothetical protein